MFDHNETDLLKILIAQARETNALLADEKRLLQFVAAETLASKQLLQQIVDNTNALPPKLSRIKIQFKEHHMATAGPITLTSVGQTATASVLGFDQFGNAWTGELPTAVLSSDDNLGSIVTFDPAIGLVTDVANGVANITATLTTAEGTVLTDTEAVTVANPVAPPPTPILSSIKVAFA